MGQPPPWSCRGTIASLLATPPADVDPGLVLPLSQLQVRGIGRRVRKRDPRLVCPNYLACPEMAAAALVELLAGAREEQG
jgi:hypothetical protein